VEGGAPPVLRVRSDLQQREVVGQVLAENGILLLTVNDRKVSPNQNGVFSVNLPIQPNGTLVDIIAVDPSGARAQKRFVMAPEPGTRLKEAETGSAVVARSADPEPLPAIEFGDYYALLIGNNEYQYLPKLLTPINDIEAAEEILHEKYAFKEVKTLKNATRYDIITALNELRKTLTEKDNLIIYYAGHGELDKINMTGQWLPVDAETNNTANWISNGAITELVNAIPAKHIMVVADSCYSGIMTRSALTQLDVGRSDDARVTWIEKMAKKRSRTVLTSGGVAPVLDEGGGNHSVFAKAFLRILENNRQILEGQTLFRQVSAAVALAADRYNVDQVPEYAPIKHAGHESGDFFLVPVL
jgi:uncharacterized caspase-like protein